MKNGRVTKKFSFPKKIICIPRIFQTGSCRKCWFTLNSPREHDFDELCFWKIPGILSSTISKACYGVDQRINGKGCNLPGSIAETIETIKTTEPTTEEIFAEAGKAVEKQLKREEKEVAMKNSKANDLVSPEARKFVTMGEDVPGQCLLFPL